MGSVGGSVLGAEGDVGDLAAGMVSEPDASIFLVSPGAWAHGQLRGGQPSEPPALGWGGSCSQPAEA